MIYRRFLVCLAMMKGVWTYQLSNLVGRDRWCTVLMNKRTKGPIDPLDYVKQSGPTAPSLSRPVFLDQNNEEKEKEMRQIEPRAISQKYEEYDGQSIEQRLVATEAELLQSLPFNTLASYRQICSALVPRIAFMILIIHVMLLLPALRFVKVDLGLSIGPFLYIAPVLLTVPFVSFFLWEADIYESPLITNGLELYIAAEKSKAWNMLTRDSARLLAEIRETDDAAARLSERSQIRPGGGFSSKLNRESQGGPSEGQGEGEEVIRRLLRKLASARLVARINPAALCQQTMAGKQRRAGKATLLNSSPVQSTSTTALLAGQSTSLLDAAKLLIDDIAGLGADGISPTRSSDEEVLVQLRKLQSQFETAAQNAGKGSSIKNDA